eukprot:TRINITY_DN3064_c0_g1_i1.p1 TRINITY_DN3064_c0_g1~~TRINITY_DN3064_c0_g1_i1.p1  ORF type:complete len:431 (-),score=118.52 TRINITY_DN3064_c0_g1_i1:1085-2335(-)
MKVLFLIFSLFVVGCYLQIPRRPEIYSQFTSSILQTQITSAIHYSDQPGYYFYDEPNSRYRINLILGQIFDVPIGIETKEDFIALEDSFYFTYNDVCRPIGFGAKFSPIFEATKYADFIGNTTIRGRPVSHWQFLEEGTVQEDFYVSQSDPNQIVVLSTYLEQTNQNTTIYFGKDFKAVVPNPSKFEVPFTCNKNFTCPSQGTLTSQMIRFHSSSDYSLANHNVADIRGDTVFLCLTLVPNVHQVDTLISNYTVQYDSSFSQYAFCNAGFCFGSTNSRSVGREASIGEKVHTGQCINNTYEGSWYSLTKRGECSSNQNIGENGCAWKTIQREKTISSDCLKTYNFVEACNTDATFPFNLAYGSLLKAFEQCPDIPPSSPSKPLIEIQEENMIDLEYIFQNPILLQTFIEISSVTMN